MVDIRVTSNKNFPVDMFIDGRWQSFTKKASIEIEEKLAKINVAFQEDSE